VLAGIRERRWSSSREHLDLTLLLRRTAYTSTDIGFNSRSDHSDQHFDEHASARRTLTNVGTAGTRLLVQLGRLKLVCRPMRFAQTIRF
jgi:hypothetical protein